MPNRKKRIRAIALSVIFCTQLFCGCASAAEESTSSMQNSRTIVTDLTQYITPEIFVMYQDGTHELLSYDSMDALEQALSTLSQDPSISLAQPNYTYTDTAQTVNDSLFPEQWALENDGTFTMQDETNPFPVFDDPFEIPAQPGQWHHPAPNIISQPRNGFHRRFSSTSTDTTATAVSGIDINVQEAWNLYNGGNRETIVAIIDTGIDYTNPELTDHIWTNANETANNGIDDDGNGYVDDVYGWNFYNNTNKIYVGEEDDHGTHCAGTIAASSNNTTGTTGIVSSDTVKIMSLKALGGSNGSGTTASIISAITYAEANGASIINLSLGASTDDPALYQTMANSNMLFVVAAGNGNETSSIGVNIDASPIYPAAYTLDNIISVANLNCDGTLHYSSNYGSTSVDLAAPGSYILSTATNGTYSYMTGTSMAAPMVTAAAAMLYSHYDDITLSQIKSLLLKTATPLDSLSDCVTSGGMLNLGAAMTYKTSALSNENWSNPETVENTNSTSSTPSVSSPSATPNSSFSPNLSATSFFINGKTYLKLCVSDADNDLSRVAYASGSYSATDFTNGDGNNIVLNSQNYIIFNVSQSGKYTFYAEDQSGHQSFLTLDLSLSYAS